MKQKPVAIGLLVCDQVIVEEKTRNLTPVNCFSRRTVRQFPSEPFPFVVFALLTDGLGEMSVDVVIQRLDDLEEIYRATLPCRFPDPLQTIRCTFRIRDCSFPVSGQYQVSLVAEGEMLAQRKISILNTETVT